MNKRLLLATAAAIALCSSPGFSQSGGGAGVKTVTDGATTVNNANKITVSGASVTNSGGGNATITVSGGGGGSSTSITNGTYTTYWQYNPSANVYESTFLSNIAGYNVSQFRNANPLGYSAATAGGDDCPAYGTEHSAVGYGNKQNPASPGIFGGRTYWEGSYVAFPNNLADTTLSGAINNSATSIVVAATTNLPTISGCSGYLLEIEPGSANSELVYVTSAASTTLTVIRGAYGTSAVAHNNGVEVASLPTPDMEIVQSGMGRILGSTSWSSLQRVFLPRTRDRIDFMRTYNDRTNTQAVSVDTVNSRLSIGAGTAPGYSIDIGKDSANSGELGIRMVNQDGAGNDRATIRAFGTANNTNINFAGQIGVGLVDYNGTIASGYTLGQFVFGGAVGTLTTTYAEPYFAASIVGVAEGTFSASNSMPTGISFRTGSTGNLMGGTGPFGAEAAHIWQSGNVTIGSYSSDPANGALLNINGTGSATVWQTATFNVGSLASVTSPAVLNCAVFSSACEIHLAAGGSQGIRLDSNTEVGSSNSSTFWVHNSLWAPGIGSRGTSANFTVDTWDNGGTLLVANGTSRKLAFYSGSGTAKQTPTGACAGNTGCQALRDALGTLGLINTGSISN